MTLIKTPQRVAKNCCCFRLCYFEEATRYEPLPRQNSHAATVPVQRWALPVQDREVCLDDIFCTINGCDFSGALITGTEW